MDGKIPVPDELRPLLAEWRERQAELASQVIVRPLRPLPRFVAGADLALSPDGAWMLAAAVVYDREARAVVETSRGSARLVHPYIPGYLGFREGPALLDAIGRLRSPYGAILFDGMGIAHPRRCGIAVQMAVTLDVPGVGVGKSRLWGRYREPAATAGSYEPLWDGQEQIGVVLRTKNNVNPLFISVGHKVDLDSARELVMACCAGYRLPEPTRLADKEAARSKVGWQPPS
jgi:deoxyribonuclease V